MTHLSRYLFQPREDAPAAEGVWSSRGCQPRCLLGCAFEKEEPLQLRTIHDSQSSRVTTGCTLGFRLWMTRPCKISSWNKDAGRTYLFVSLSSHIRDFHGHEWFDLMLSFDAHSGLDLLSIDSLEDISNRQHSQQKIAYAIYSRIRQLLPNLSTLDRRLGRQ